MEFSEDDICFVKFWGLFLEYFLAPYCILILFDWIYSGDSGMICILTLKFPPPLCEL